MARELRDTGEKDAAVFHEFREFRFVFLIRRMPSEVGDQLVVLVKVGVRLDWQTVEIAVRRAREEESSLVESLAQRMSGRAGHQNVDDLTRFFRLTVAPLGSGVAVKAPDRVMRILLDVADEPVERSSPASLKERDLADVFAAARMRRYEPEEAPRHIALALGERVVPALSLFLVKLEERVLFVDRVRSHHPRLEDREEVLAEMVFVIRLQTVLDRDVRAPAPLAERFRRRSRLSEKRHRVGDHRLRAYEIRAGEEAVPDSARCVAERGAGADLVGAVDLCFEIPHIFLRRGLHVLRRVGFLGIARVDLAGVFVRSDIGEHIPRRLR